MTFQPVTAIVDTIDLKTAIIEYQREARAKRRLADILYQCRMDGFQMLDAEAFECDRRAEAIQVYINKHTLKEGKT